MLINSNLSHVIGTNYGYLLSIPYIYILSQIVDLTNAICYTYNQKKQIIRSAGVNNAA